MRLLEILGPGQFRLTQDFIDYSHPYAILSHTWGKDNEEVTFRDMIEGTGKDKDGYRKIRFCGDQAARDGLRYFWVDTCCIDKSSSSELTEAINSMFHWYRDAAKCYVYLSDVSTVTSVTSTEDNQLSDCRWKPAFRKSRWFTRGWTLQELIAPSTVEFFSAEGEQLCSKKSTEKQIFEITGVDIKALQGHPLSCFSISERMSWAKNRNTRREEDMVYSLLGIFDVHMPLIYSEGRQKALTRLQKEISDNDIFSRLPSAKGATFDSFDERHNATCLPDTRVDLQQQIIAWAENQSGKSIFWLNGMAGTGKSTIARTMANTFARKSQLGASFFFKKGEGDRGDALKFFPTIAAQLSQALPQMIPGIRRAVDADPTIPGKTLKEQFEKLILDPMSDVAKAVSQRLPFVVVIDALDECDKDDDIQLILQLLSRLKDINQVSARVFVTSRPDLPIRLGFSEMSSTEYQDVILHEVRKETIGRDIFVFFKCEFEKIRKQRGLPLHWPGEETICVLVEMAVPLFIFAATVCRFIGDKRSNPRRNLKEIINRKGGRGSQLDLTYLPIVNQLFPSHNKEHNDEAVEDFQRVVGTIILLANPLSIGSLANLLDIDKHDVTCTLDLLHAALSVPLDETQPIRVLHLSFRDFLLQSQNCKQPFWIDEKQTHKSIATRCLELLCRPGILKQDLCNLRKPGVIRTEINSQLIDKCLLAEIKYACRYWVHHTQQSDIPIQDGDAVHRFLQTKFLYWLEALSLIGEVSGSISMITSLLSCLEVRYIYNYNSIYL